MVSHFYSNCNCFLLEHLPIFFGHLDLFFKLDIQFFH